MALRKSNTNLATHHTPDIDTFNYSRNIPMDQAIFEKALVDKVNKVVYPIAINIPKYIIIGTDFAKPLSILESSNIKITKSKSEILNIPKFKLATPESNVITIPEVKLNTPIGNMVNAPNIIPNIPNQNVITDPNTVIVPPNLNLIIDPNTPINNVIPINQVSNIATSPFINSVYGSWASSFIQIVPFLNTTINITAETPPMLPFINSIYGQMQNSFVQIIPFMNFSAKPQLPPYAANLNYLWNALATPMNIPNQYKNILLFGTNDIAPHIPSSIIISKFINQIYGNWKTTPTIINFFSSGQMNVPAAYDNIILLDSTFDLPLSQYNSPVVQSSHINYTNITALNTATKDNFLKDFKFSWGFKDYDSFFMPVHFNTLKIGAGDNVQPFIMHAPGNVFEIGRTSIKESMGVPRRSSTEFIRGNEQSVLSISEDVYRMTMFSASPAGLLWNIQQAGMQLMNPLTDKTTGQLIQPTRIYNPLIPIVQAGINPIGGHMPRHLYLLNNSDYESVTRVNNDNETFEKTNRLAKISQDLGIFKYHIGYPFSGDPIKNISGFGGPNSVYGVGWTDFYVAQKQNFAFDAQMTSLFGNELDAIRKKYLSYYDAGKYPQLQYSTDGKHLNIYSQITEIYGSNIIGDEFEFTKTPIANANHNTYHDMIIDTNGYYYNNSLVNNIIFIGDAGAKYQSYTYPFNNWDGDDSKAKISSYINMQKLIDSNIINIFDNTANSKNQDDRQFFTFDDIFAYSTSILDNELNTKDATIPANISSQQDINISPIVGMFNDTISNSEFAVDNGNPLDKSGVILADNLISAPVGKNWKGGFDTTYNSFLTYKNLKSLADFPGVGAGLPDNIEGYRQLMIDKIKPTYPPVEGINRMERRVGISDAGNDNADWMYDNTQYYKDAEGQQVAIKQDFVKFYITIIRYKEDGSNDSKISKQHIQFRNTIASLTYNFSPTWRGIDYIGNPGKSYIFQDLVRKISTKFIVAAQSRTEMAEIYKKLNLLARQVAPSYTMAGNIMSPMVELTIGDYISQEPAIIEGLSFEVQDDFIWDIGYNKVKDGADDPRFGPSEQYELPMYISVNADFTFLNKETPDRDLSNFFGPDKWL